jgi:hypothetical protein
MSDRAAFSRPSFLANTATRARNATARRSATGINHHATITFVKSIEKALVEDELGGGIRKEVWPDDTDAPSSL